MADTQAGRRRWDLEDFAAWEAMMQPATVLNRLFMEALAKECAVCVPPDRCLRDGAVLDEATMRAHILMPHCVFKDRYVARPSAVEPASRGNNSNAKSGGFSLFRKPSDVTPRSANGAGETSSPSASAEDNEVEYIESPVPHLICSGPAWPDGPSRFDLLVDDEIKTSEGSARVFVLDRLLFNPHHRSPNGTAAAAASQAARGMPALTPANEALFGDSPDDNVMTATDTLFNLDRDGSLMKSLNAELQAFRERYKPVQGYEDDLFGRVKAIAKAQSKKWVAALGCSFVSRRRSERATVIAVDTYVHGRLYQFVFPAVCGIQAESSTEFEVGAEAIQRSGKGLVDFEVPSAVANRIDVAPLRPLFNRFNVATSPFDKLQIAGMVLDMITTIVTKATQGRPDAMSADLLVPVLALSLATFPPKDMAAHVAYMEKFVPPEALTGADEARSYTLVSFRAAVEYIRRYSDEETVQRRMSDISMAPGGLARP